MTRRRLFVTGAGGFIGTHLCAKLREADHELQASPEGCDAVIHLANIAHAKASASELQRVNVEGTLEQARRARAAGARRFLYLSSIKARAPEDEYGRSKRRAEEVLAGMSTLDPIILRPPLVYGPGVKANFLSLMQAIDRGWPLPLAGVQNRRSLLYVGNLVDAILRCVEPGVAGGLYELSDGVTVSTPELCREIGKALQRPVRLFTFPQSLLPRRLVDSVEVDDSAFRAAFRWRPPFAMQQGLRLTAGWYRSR